MFSGRVLATYRAVISSYWFLPLTLILGGVLLAIGLTLLDQFVGEGLLPQDLLLGPTTPEGARTLLSTIGGSMLSVAGVVFSVTLATIVFASGQYGPHVLPQYQRDRQAQATLGLMLAAFAYCTTALFTVQAGEKDFVPALAILGALALAAAAIGMLIAFIAHMLAMLHISNIVARIAEQTLHLLDDEMPLNPPRDAAASGTGRKTEFLTGEGDPLLCGEGRGYISTIGTQKLVELAKEHDLQADILVRPGDFVTPLSVLARLTPALPDEEAQTALRHAFAWGRRRTPDEDVAFTLDELCTIAFRALSPGINDPFTATDVLRHLTAIIERASSGKCRPSIHSDEEGVPRIRRPALSFGDVVRLTLDRLATDAARNPTVAPIMLEVYDDLLIRLSDEDHRERLLRSAETFAKACADQLSTEGKRQDIAEAMARLRRRAASERGAGTLRISRLEEGVGP